MPSGQSNRSHELTNPVSNVQGTEDEDTEQKIVNEGATNLSNGPTPATDLILEYKTWKKNSPFLYDMILR